MIPQGNMHSNMVMGTFPTRDGETTGQVHKPIFNVNGILAQELEKGSLFVPKGWLNNEQYPNGKRWEACGEDGYIDYYSVPRNKVFSNALRVGFSVWNHWEYNFAPWWAERRVCVLWLQMHCQLMPVFDSNISRWDTIILELSSEVT